MIIKQAKATLIIFLGMMTILQAESIFGKSKQEVINSFAFRPFLTVHDHKDSINIHTYLSIPFTSLQFIKSDSGYYALYQASVIIKDGKSKDQLYRRTWKDTIFADDYLQTTNRKMYRVQYAGFTVLTGSYILLSEIVDGETQYVGNSKIEVDTETYGKSVVLYPSIIVEKNDSDIELIDGWFPQLTEYQLYDNTGLNLFVCGKIIPGDYSIQLTINSLERNETWSERYNFVSTANTFSQIITVPDSILTGLKINVKTELIQNGNTRAQEMTIPLLKPGVSMQITNIHTALDQMAYILTNEERTLLKKTKKANMEELFVSLWSKRDPTPGTLSNELMDEYYNRVDFANNQFSDLQSGWHTDQGMIYILFGKPDTIDRAVARDRRTVYEVWSYYNINKQFVFKDENGFGEFRLDTPYYLNPNFIHSP